MKIGCDIIKIDRINNILKNKEKVFTKAEIEYCEKFIDKNVHYASIFCAKEAVFKALDIEKSTLGSMLLQIEILHKESGRPYVKLYDTAKKKLGDSQIDISISNEKNNAIAMAIIF